MSKVLIIDDDSYINNILVNYLNQKGFYAEGTLSGANGLTLLKEKAFDVVLCDYRLPNTDGYEVLKSIKKLNPDLPVIVMTAYADIKISVKLIKSGAFDYVSKPIQPDEIVLLIQKAVLKGKKSSQPELSNGFITGTSEKIKTVLEHVTIVAPTDLSVLIEGETGSGKEYVAREIHKKSKRSNKNFVAVDCGALPNELASSELFGHVKGAFTGASNDKKGYFEYAKGGTIFLDEIGNLAYENQVKLLRAIQEKVITPVGSARDIAIDVRLIAATNDNLLTQVNENNFREDLYHRINGFKLRIPSLYERKEDIMEFAQHFIQMANKEFNRSVEKVDEEVEHIFYQYRWHGNIRELHNIINRAVLLTAGDTIVKDTLPEEIKHEMSTPAYHIKNDTSQGADLKEVTNKTEKEVIEQTLELTKYNKSKAAKILNIDRKTLYNKISQYDIQLPN